MNKIKTIPFLLVFFLFSLYAWSQTIVVTGRIVSAEDGLGMPSVTVKVKGTSAGTVSDINGDYSISVDSKGVLEFSFIGYESKMINVNGRKKIDITLHQSSEMLEGVVVTALAIISPLNSSVE